MEKTRKIHQTWRDEHPPEEQYPAAWQQSWRSRNPAWDYRLWTDADLAELFAAKHPQWLPLFADAPGVVKADLGRLAVLFHEGGLYADMDYICLKPMDPIISEPLHLSGLRREEVYIHNALIYAAPRHPLLGWLLREAAARVADPQGRPVEDLCGPGLFSELIPAWVEKYRLQLGWWEPKQVCPVDWKYHSQAAKTVPREWLLQPSRYFEGSHAVTFWGHHW